MQEGHRVTGDSRGPRAQVLGELALGLESLPLTPGAVGVPDGWGATGCRRGRPAVSRETLRPGSLNPECTSVRCSAGVAGERGP